MRLRMEKGKQPRMQWKLFVIAHPTVTGQRNTLEILRELTPRPGLRTERRAWAGPTSSLFFSTVMSGGSPGGAQPGKTLLNVNRIASLFTELYWISLFFCSTQCLLKMYEFWEDMLNEEQPGIDY